MDYIIKRSEASELAGKNYWMLLYGRRKVGKTFMLRNFFRYDDYYTVRKDLSIVSDKGQVKRDVFVGEIKALLERNKVVVIDEFQRLDESALEEIMLLHPKGKLVLSGSSLKIVKKIFEPNSPLLGFFTPVRISFIRPSDAVIGLKKRLNSEKRIELAAFIREPWIIPLYGGEEITDFIYSVIKNSKHTIRALLGEIFTEEERELSRKYETLLNLIGSGIWNTKELTSLMYSRKLIPDPSPNHIIQYIKNLEEMELVESIKLHRTKGRFYRLASPIMNIFYYLESRYDISSRDISLEEIKPTLEKLINMEIQNFIADIFAEMHNGRKEYYVSPDKEVDFIITKRNKPEIVGEVKWKKINSEDVKRFKAVSENFRGKPVMVCKTGKQSGDIEILDAEDIVSMIEKRAKVSK